MNTILHIEDEGDIREVARIALEQLGGFSVTEASSGSEGVALAAELRPDLILLDVMMPGMDGPATLRALRECPQTAGIPVVFMTAKVRRHEIEHYLELGARGVIAKPFDPITLADQVKALSFPGPPSASPAPGPGVSPEGTPRP